MLACVAPVSPLKPGAPAPTPGETVTRGTLAVLGEGEGVAVTTDREAARFILVAGKPLREPVARYGPFVMNTEAELRQAVADYQSGRF